MSDKAEKARIGKLILAESDLEFQVTHSGEVFTMKYPAPFERAAIEAEMARRLGGDRKSVV